MKRKQIYPRILSHVTRRICPVLLKKASVQEETFKIQETFFLPQARHSSTTWKEDAGSSSMRSKDKRVINRYRVSRIKSLRPADRESERSYYYLPLLCETRAVYFIVTSSACRRCAGATTGPLHHASYSLNKFESRR